METYCTTHEDAQFTNTGAVQSLLVETKELTGASKQTAYETEINEVVCKGLLKITIAMREGGVWVCIHTFTCKVRFLKI